MKLLLDTHVWIWHLLADPRLSPHHRQIIEDRNTDPGSRAHLRHRKAFSHHLLTVDEAIRRCPEVPCVF